jgi:Fic family protein
MRLPKRAPNLEPFQILRSADFDLTRRVLDVEATLPDGRYLHWSELRYRTPPEGLTLDQWWAGTNMRRQRDAAALTAMREAYPEVPFRFTSTPSIQRSMHDFDRTNVGREILSALGNPDAKLEYQIRQLIEEAISSSEIEGARPTTRELARQLLREKRKPASRDEKMIVNNLHAMERLGELHRAGEPLTIERLLELHRILGEDALEVPGAEGQFRTSEHPIDVADDEGNVWHVPPPAEGLEARVQRLLVFANCEDDAKPSFVHPIIRAIVVHFWLGYEHPFRDGNGRIARALYYWCMLKSGYDVAEFLSISGPIVRSPHAYYKAFAFTELDDGDLTYFIIHQLEVMRVALKELLEHLSARATRLKALSSVVASYAQLNYRQRSMLDFSIRHLLQGQTIDSYATSYGVHYHTARADLAELEKRGLLRSERTNKTKRYYPSPQLMSAKPPELEPEARRG